jgi:Uncharacterized protein conserved in bacteria (DUF2169)
MKLHNASGFPAEMLIGSTGEFEQLAIVVCKITYAMDSRGGLTPAAPESAWPVFRGPVMVNGVTLGSELDYMKRGIDILVFGEAVAPRNEAVTSMTVEVRCGPVQKSIDVIGDRRWLRDSSIRQLLGGSASFTISDPEPFVSMPLSNDRAFGGASTLDGQPADHPINPGGRGYVRDEALVEGIQLPNLERPDQRIRDWRDDPIPACMFKPTGLLFDATGPCSLAGLAEGGDASEALRRLLPRMLNHAVPDLICAEGELGRTLTLSGFDPQGPVRFPLPPERSLPGKWGPCVRAAIGGKRSRFPLEVVTVAAFLPQRALVVTYRGLFRYLFVPEELRAAELVFAGNPYLEPAAGDA